MDLNKKSGHKQILPQHERGSLKVRNYYKLKCPSLGISSIFNLAIDDLAVKPTSHTKVYFNEFIANVLRDNIGIVIFDLRGHGGCWRPKTPLGGQQ